MAAGRSMYPDVVPDTIAIIVSDLMFQSRIAAASASLGHAALVADDDATLAAALAGRARLAVVDLHIAGIDALDAIRRAKAAGARVLAFGRHTEPATLRAARAAGADAAVPRSQLVEELPALLRSLMAAEQASQPGCVDERSGRCYSGGGARTNL